MQAQDKSIKGVHSSTSGGVGHLKFVGNKNSLAYGESLNTLVTLGIANDMKINKKSKTTDNSDLDNESENFNFGHLNIRSDSDSE